MHSNPDKFSSGIYRAYNAIIIGIYYIFGFLISTLFFFYLINVVSMILLEQVFTSGGAQWVAYGVSTIPGFVFLYFRWKGAKWRRENPEAHRAAELERAAVQARKKAAEEAAMEAARNRPPDAIDTAIEGLFNLIGGLFSLALGIIVLGVILYVSYIVVTTVSTPVAIIIGAVIIGLCILAAASST